MMKKFKDIGGRTKEFALRIIRLMEVTENS